MNENEKTNNSPNEEKHIPVMVDEVLKFLITREDGNYADLTFGTGGHSKSILKKIKNGKLISFEMDKEQVEMASKDTFFFKPNFLLIEDNYINFLTHLKKMNIEKLNGILLDLGLSSYQLKCFHRGFSFRTDAPLDMRISCSDSTLTAEYVVNNYTADQLTRIFRLFGEEKLASVIARKIVSRRKIKKIERTQELVGIVASCFEVKKKKHPARKVFQALRIYLNNELENLNEFLNEAFDHLDIKGRIVIISYNSLEDKIVKKKFKEKEKTNLFHLVNKKVITPSKEEIIKNNRARSAKMRIIEKI